MATTEQSTGNETQAAPGDFGANEWLVEDMYERYLADPGSVDAAWHDFFDDYRPSTGSGVPDTVADTLAAVAPAATPAVARQDSGTPPTTTGTSPTALPKAQAAPAQADAPAAPATPATPAAPATPATPGTPATKPAAPAAPAAPATKPAEQPERPAETHTEQVIPLRGAAARVVANMQTSLTVPTATSVRAVPAKLISDNRVVINNHLRRARGGKVSFTHIIGYAIVQALRDYPEMNNHFAEIEGKPAVVTPDHVNLGIAIDLVGKDNSRSLVVAAIRSAETLDFAGFWNAYEDIIRRARAGKLTADDFAGTTISLTNPGTIGTNHSVPRLMAGQGTIVGVGAMDYPAEFSGMSEEQLTERAISKIMTLTSTYDHRIIQGAQSGEFLRRIHQLLLADEFYDRIFAALRIPYEPVRWLVDREFSHEGQIDKSARIIELINAYRTNGHLMADTDPLEFTVRTHPDLDITRHGLTLWDLDREFPVDGFAGAKLMKLRDILGVLRDAYCRRVGVEYMHITDPSQRQWIQQRIELKHDQPSREAQLHILGRLNVAEAFETFLQ
ncbi:MAG: 2-oxoglutarate dehydrogenase, subunit, partial [Pseudonocardiales bacterium]|nr:2-oxoglutarate dehydrogenase, subunit [Pseudonocardiales bacterium]